MARAVMFGVASACVAAAVGTTFPAKAQRPALDMLSHLSAGQWELRIRETGAIQRMCLGNRMRLIQIRHPDLDCNSIVVEDSLNSVTVQYTCRGRGYGRTHIRRETGQLVQIESQGIADGRPFEFSAEGRRVSDC